MPYINDEMPGGSRPLPTAGAPLQWRANPKPVDDPTTQAFNELKAANESYGEFLGAVHAQAEHYRADPEAIKATIDAFPGTDAAGLVGSAEHRASENTAAAKAEYQRVLEGLTPAGDTASELRRDRALNRTINNLNAMPTGARGNAVQQAIADADNEARAVLLQELPSWCKQNGLPASLVENAAVAVVPELADAANKVKAAERDEQVIRHSANAVRDGWRRRSPATALVDPATTRK
jgi:hypothetical protein